LSFARSESILDRSIGLPTIDHIVLALATMATGFDIWFSA
jgi:hypothetical protein